MTQQRQKWVTIQTQLNHSKGGWVAFLGCNVRIGHLWTATLLRVFVWWLILSNFQLTSLQVIWMSANSKCILTVSFGDCHPSDTVQVFSVYSWLNWLPVVLTTLQVLQTLCTLAAWWPKCPTISRSVWRCFWAATMLTLLCLCYICSCNIHTS